MDVDAFAADGFVKVEQAVPRAMADAARAALWAQLRCSPEDPASWTQPVAWVSDLTGAGPFGEIAASPALFRALDAICGAGTWAPRTSLGNIPVRFPVRPPADDRGWHVDLNTPMPDGSWAVSARPRTVVVLTLLSEVTRADAPTRIRVGSHRDAAAALPDVPLDAAAASPLVAAASRHRPVAYATGMPGDMYVMHALTVHAADEHRGATPRFMAQSPVMLR